MYVGKIIYIHHNKLIHMDKLKPIINSIRNNSIVKDGHSHTISHKLIKEAFLSIGFKEKSHFRKKYYTKRKMGRKSSFYWSLRKTIKGKKIHVILRRGKVYLYSSIHQDGVCYHKAVPINKEVVEILVKGLIDFDNKLESKV